MDQNRLTMHQFSKVLLAIDNAHTVSQWALDCGPGFGTKNEIWVWKWSLILSQVKWREPCILSELIFLQPEHKQTYLYEERLGP